MRILIITSVRNEAPFLLEWIAYHRLIGVTDFLIYSNDCDDGTDQMLDHLQEIGVVTHEPNPRSGKKAVQWKALQRARNHPLLKQADWVYFTDMDEFLCIHAGEGHLQDLFNAQPDADGFALSWRMFGNNKRESFEDGLMIAQFTQCAPDRMLWPWKAVQFKSLWKNSPGLLDKLGVHRPQFKEDAPPFTWVDDNGTKLKHLNGTMIPSAAPRYGLAQINHYALGSVENFLAKADRGKPNRTTEEIDLVYWVDRNFNQVEDRRILRFEDKVRAQMAAWLEDETLRGLHQDGVAWRKQRIAALKEDVDQFYMYSRIAQLGPTPELPMDAQLRNFQHLIRLMNPSQHT